MIQQKLGLWHFPSLNALESLPQMYSSYLSSKKLLKSDSRKITWPGHSLPCRQIKVQKGVRTCTPSNSINLKLSVRFASNLSVSLANSSLLNCWLTFSLMRRSSNVKTVVLFSLLEAAFSKPVIRLGRKSLCEILISYFAKPLEFECFGYASIQYSSVTSLWGHTSKPIMFFELFCSYSET